MGRLVFGLLKLLALPSLAVSDTHVVRPDGTGDFPTIQEAVDAAASGDVIELTDGTFAGDGNRGIHVWEKTLTVRSQSGDPTRCVIDAEGAARCIGFYYTPYDETCLLEGITLANGSTDWGGGLIIDTSHMIVRRCIFSGNHSEGNGGAVMLDWAWATFHECTFLGNDGGAGGAFCT